MDEGCQDDDAVANRILIILLQDDIAFWAAFHHDVFPVPSRRGFLRGFLFGKQLTFSGSPPEIYLESINF